MKPGGPHTLPASGPFVERRANESGCAAFRERHDETNGFRWIFLRRHPCTCCEKEDQRRHTSEKGQCPWRLLHRTHALLELHIVFFDDARPALQLVAHECLEFFGRSARSERHTCLCKRFLDRGSL